MAKRFKLRFSKVIPFFLLCRSKHPNRQHINPLPIPKPHRSSLDISYHCFPNPPPSTPISYPVICGESNDGDVSSTSPLAVKKRAGKKKGAIFRTRASSETSSYLFSSDEDKVVETSESLKLGTKTKRKAVTLSDKGNKAETFLTKQGMQSVAVEKKSDDPYTDFRNSMLEMIVEKEMFEVNDLEDLLQCFLSLNSRQHHQVIVEAFTEIWDALFSKSPLDHNRRYLVAKECTL